MRLIQTSFVIALELLSWHEAVAAGDVKAGEVVYNQHCIDCHGTGLKGAPKLGDKDAWANRIGKGDLYLTDQAFYGHRKMPMLGNCGSCTYEDYANAVAYMVSKAKANAPSSTDIWSPWRD
jgi:cytochrome c5